MERSTECLRLITEHLKGERPVIASGGVMTGEDAVIKMRPAPHSCSFIRALSTRSSSGG